MVAEETKMFIDAYTMARKKFIELGELTTIAPRQHIGMRSAVSRHWLTYQLMLEEHNRELANELDEFGYQYRQLSAWEQVLPGYEAEDQMALMREFVKAIATSCVSHPHTLKARFVFSVNHLTHQARLITDPSWSEKKLPADRQIDTSMMVAVAKPSEEYTQFKEKYTRFKKNFDELCSKDYESATDHFRNKHHHRYPPRVEMGVTQLVTRITKDGKAVYGFGGAKPLKLRELTPLLLEQHEKAMQCFDSYSALVRKQLAEIYDTAAT